MELGDNAVPQEEPVVGNLTDKPLQGEVYRAKPARNRDHKRAVRRDLAIPILWVLLATYVLAIGSFIVARFLPENATTYTSADLTAVIAGISGLQGLAAAIVGFFFGGKSTGKSRQQ